MPNHCTNILVFGSDEDKETFLSYVKPDDTSAEDIIDFNKVIPCDNTCDAHRAQWGTKWNAYWITVKKDTVVFTTAWNPPSGVMRALTEQMPTIPICWLYYEDGSAFCGFFIAAEGKEVALYLEPEDRGYKKLRNVIQACDDDKPNKKKRLQQFIKNL